MAQKVWAGHAGDMGSPFLMPHELMGWLVFLGILGLALLFLVGVALRVLLRIERRLKKLEHLTPGKSD